VVSGVADGKRNVVGGDLVADLSRGLDDGLDDRGVGNGTDRGKGSRGDNWGSSVGESGENLRVSLPLHNSVGKGQSVAKTVVAETSVSHSGNSRGSNDWMVDNRADRGVVDQGGGGRKNGGTSSNDSRVSLSIPLHNSVGQGESVAKTMVASISDSSNSGGATGTACAVTSWLTSAGVTSTDLTTEWLATAPTGAKLKAAGAATTGAAA